MRFEPRTWRIFWDLHAWAGALTSLVLFVMFFMGAFAPFQSELDAWAEPSAGPATATARLMGPPIASDRSAAQPALGEGAARPALGEGAARPALTPLLAQLERERAIAGVDRMIFRPDRNGLSVSLRRAGQYTEYRFDPAQGRLEPVQSGLGSFLHSMHYLGPIPYGIWLAGFAAMGLCLALASGLIIHYDDLVRQLFQFRLGRSVRIWASDGHKTLGVLALPFQVLYAWSGAVLVLGYLVVGPALQRYAFNGDEAALSAARGELPALPEPAVAVAAPLPDLDALLRAAVERIPGLEPSSIVLEHVGDALATVSLEGGLAGRAFASVEMQLRVVDGALLGMRAPDSANAYRRFDDVFRRLHYASFGGYLVKLLYALLAWATCATIVTGNVIWLERRDPARARAGNRLLERLTVGACAGVILATAALFSMNRLADGAGTSRAALEQRVFWAAWAAALALPLIWRQPRRAAALELGLAGALFASAVAIDIALHPGHIDNALQRSVLLVFALFGSAMLFGGARLWRPRDPAGELARAAASAR